MTKLDQEPCEIWYDTVLDRTFLLLELKDTVPWRTGMKPISRWKSYCFETGSCEISNFNSDAPDYNIWKRLA